MFEPMMQNLRKSSELTFAFYKESVSWKIFWKSDFEAIYWFSMRMDTEMPETRDFTDLLSRIWLKPMFDLAPRLFNYCYVFGTFS